MLSPSELKPRPLWDGQLPERGDLHFAVGLSPKSALVSRTIPRASPASHAIPGMASATRPMKTATRRRW